MTSATTYDARSVINATKEHTERLTSVVRVDAGDLDVLLYHEQLTKGILRPIHQTAAPGAADLYTPTKTAIQQQLEILQDVVGEWNLGGGDPAAAVIENEQYPPPPWLLLQGGMVSDEDAARVQQVIAKNQQVRQLLMEREAKGQEPFTGPAHFHDEQAIVGLEEAHAILEGRAEEKDALEAILRAPDGQALTAAGADFKLIATYGVLVAQLLASKDRESLTPALADRRSDLLRVVADDRPYLPLWLVEADISAQRLAELLEEESTHVVPDELKEWQEAHEKEILQLHRDLNAIRDRHAKHVAYLADHNVV